VAIGKTIPIATDAERALFDFRRRPASGARWPGQPHYPDPLHPGHIGGDGQKRSPLDRAILAKALANIDKMGAKAIGIDILIDQPQPEDAQLLADAEGDEDAGLAGLCQPR
jgi:adenylate cyclase